MTKVHDVFTVEHQKMRELPTWITRFIDKAQERPNTAKPPVLLLTPIDLTDTVVVVRLADLVQMIGGEK